MKSLKDVRGGLENVVRKLTSDQRGNAGGIATVGLGLIAVAGMITFCAYAVTQPRISDMQPYADGSTVQGVVLAERSNFGRREDEQTIDAVDVVLNTFGRQKIVNEHDLVLKALDGRCYSFKTAASAASESGSVIPELGDKIKPGTQVLVKDFNPRYKGTKNCDNRAYYQPVAPSQIVVITK